MNENLLLSPNRWPVPPPRRAPLSVLLPTPSTGRGRMMALSHSRLYVFCCFGCARCGWPTSPPFLGWEKEVIGTCSGIWWPACFGRFCGVLLPCYCRRAFARLPPPHSSPAACSSCVDVGDGGAREWHVRVCIPNADFGGTSFFVLRKRNALSRCSRHHSCLSVSSLRPSLSPSVSVCAHSHTK